MRSYSRMHSGLAGFAVLASLLIVGGPDMRPAFGAQPDAVPKIRSFDMATVERLGREIYAQDQLAAKATDVALAERGGERGLRRDGMRGWVTKAVDDTQTVRMIRLVRGVPEALYDIVFSPGRAPVLTIPESKSLSAEELAQYNARMLALENIGRQRCAERYNTVALKDSDSGGWLVWALAASSDDDVIVARGHHRFTISADGKTLLKKEALSTSCLNYSRREMRRDAEKRNFTVVPILTLNHIVSEKPVETYGFTSLQYEFTWFVGASDGEVWKFDKGTVTVAADDAPDPEGGTVRNLHGVAEQCGGVATNPSQMPQKYYTLKAGFKIIQPMEQTPVFDNKLADGFEIINVICGRMTIVPSPNDYKIAAGGSKLTIRDIGEGHPLRVGELLRVGDDFTFSITEGEPLPDDLAARVKRRLEVFQAVVKPKN